MKIPELNRMKSLLLLVFLIFSLTSTSQVWVEQNANWHYDYSNVAYGGFYKMEYVQDTIVGGIICQQIETTSYQFGFDQFGDLQLINTIPFPTQFTYTSGDTVFYWNDNQFFTYLNFDANIGDQWLIGTTSPAGSVCQDSSFVEVQDTGSVVINSVNYRTITLATDDSSALRLGGVFVERFGFLDSNQPFQPFPRTNYCEGAIYEWDIVTFKCFEDDAFSLYNPSGEDCEYYLTHLGIEGEVATRLKLFPNPASDFIEISSDESGTLRIFDCTGKLVGSQPFAHSQKVDLSLLENGMYLFILEGITGEKVREYILKLD